jgi:hypothetical protein
VYCLGAFEWIANQPTLQKHRSHYRIEVKACTSKKKFSGIRERTPHSSMWQENSHERKHALCHQSNRIMERLKTDVKSSGTRERYRTAYPTHSDCCGDR